MSQSVPFSYPRRRHQATVPDMLDFAERARLAIGGLTGLPDPGVDRLPCDALLSPDTFDRV